MILAFFFFYGFARIRVAIPKKNVAFPTDAIQSFACMNNIDMNLHCIP